ncbi:TPA: hypothetical protein N0F65_000815 [Lagenidium giganteum]|uniref:Uncharacterized protein n=1 Tax=Lagenidium giganteum TaxID=4803 RepID=A0AAV2YX67_9STRA|nr:TPA: hypothetical protein N0F65_000815 [Lagenidium giganteum]
MQGNNCSRFVEKVLISNVDNHYYIEGTVQPVYTTALFFLFQHGAVREEISLEDFDLDYSVLMTNNVVIPVSLFVSVPDKNAIVSIIGSVLFFLACAAVWLQHRRRPDGLQQALPANTTLHVLTNNGTFPSFLLKKTVMTRDQEVIGEGKEVQIDRVGLRGQKKSSPV